jgi:type II secretory pathway pseudopilin PulG
MSWRHRVPRVVATPWGFQPSKSTDRTETGFTLIELLIVVVVLPLVIGGIAVALVSVFSLQSGVSNRISDSGDAQVVSATFVNDVQSASEITTQSPSANPSPCETSTQFANSDPQVLGLQWVTGATPTEVSYMQDGKTLVRNVCQNGGATPVSANVVSNDVPIGQTAIITCASTVSGCATSASSGWTASSGIAGVKLAITASASQYAYVLVGVPRLWSPTSNCSPACTGGTPPPPPLLLLGDGPSVLTCGGSGKLNVTGELALNSTSNGAANLSGTAAVTASTIYTADQSTPSQAIATGPSASYTPSGTPSAGLPIPNPFADLTPPSTVGLTTHSGSTYQGPGIYTSTLSLSGNTAQVFASGIYIFEQGITVIGNATISSGSGGVLFYVAGGSVNISGNGGSTLSPDVSLASPLNNMVIWQADTDTNQLQMAGNASADVVGGTIYARNALVGGAGSGDLIAGTVVAKSLSCNGDGKITLQG